MATNYSLTITVIVFLITISIQRNPNALPQSFPWCKYQKPIFGKNIVSIQLPELFQVEPPRFSNMFLNRPTYGEDAPNPMNLLNVLPKLVFAPNPVDTELTRNEFRSLINADDLSNEIDSKEYTTEKTYTETTIDDYDTSTIDEDIVLRVGVPAAVVASLLG